MEGSPHPDLTPEQRQRYEAIIVRFEQAWHRSGQPQMSEFLTSAGSMRSLIFQELEQIDREFRQIQGQLETASVSTQHTDTKSSTKQPVADSSARFRILKPHAKGGLGEVFVAEDTELHRRVALKQIQVHRADDAHSRNRFILEAEITGGLEHPGIVPIYALGTDRRGRPYYAMRFIEGHTLQQAIDHFHDPERAKYATDSERSLEFRQLLTRFISVCQAVEYAHSRAVLHRDLKPANVMLGKFGETLVVDWGLAKARGSVRAAADSDLAETALQPRSGSSVEPTEMGQRIGTLNYMSPEQAAGQLDELGPATDIFALGATLYQLLTGKTLYHAASREQLLDCVASVRFPPPCTVLTNIPRPLEAICLKALAAKPDDRYPSAQALLADVERYLADEPVSAYREPFTLRVRRWARKRPGFVSGSAATLAVTLIALLLGTVILGHKNRELARANLAEKQQRLRAEREEAAAKANEKEAREQEAIATAVKDFLLDDLLAFVDPIRQADAQDERVKVDPDLRVRDLFVRAKEKIEERFETQPQVAAELRTLVAAPVPPELTIRAMVLRASDRIAGRFSAQPLVERSLHFLLGNALLKMGEFTRSIPHHQRSLDLSTAHFGAEHADTLAAMDHLAFANGAAGRMDECLALYQKTLQIRQAKLGREHPDTLSSMNNLAYSYGVAKRPDETIALHEKALNTWQEKFGRDDPATLKSMHNLAAAYLQAKRLDEGIALHAEALKIREAKLGREHADTLESMNYLGIAYHTAGQLDKAVQLFEETLKLREASLGREHYDTLATMGNLANAYRDQRRSAESIALLEEKLLIHQSRLGPNHPDTLVSLGALAIAYTMAGRWDKAIPLFEETLKLREGKLGREHPATLNSLQNLASAYRVTGQPDKAIPLYQETLKLREIHLGPEHPDTLSTMNQLANAYRDAGRSDEAIALLKKTLELRQAKLGMEDPDTLKSMYALASAYSDARRLGDAIPLFEVLLKATRAKRGPEHLETLAALNDLAGACRKAGRLADAIPLLEEMLKLRTATLGPQHADTLRSMNNLALAYRDAERFEEAIPLHEAALQVQLTQLGREHFDTVRTVFGLAVTLQRSKRWDDAQRNFLNAFEWAAKLPAAAQAQTRTSIAEELVKLYTAWDKPAEAEQWRKTLESLRSEPSPK